MDKPDTISLYGVRPVLGLGLPIGVETEYDTDRFGIVVFHCQKEDDTWKIQKCLPSGPSLHIYRESERNYIEATSRIAWRIVNHTSKPEVFE